VNQTAQKPLTDKQKLILQKLKDYTAEHGYQPSNQELAEMVGLQSRSTLHGHLCRMEQKGYIKVVSVRAIKILDKGDGGVEGPSGSDQASTVKASHG
jgi:repressor LexA